MFIMIVFIVPLDEIGEEFCLWVGFSFFFTVSTFSEQTLCINDSTVWLLSSAALTLLSF